MEQAWHSWFPFADYYCIPSNKRISSLPCEVLWFSNGFQHFGGPSCLHFQSWNTPALKMETAAVFEKFLYESICQTVWYRLLADTDQWLTLALCSEPNFRSVEGRDFWNAVFSLVYQMMVKEDTKKATSRKILLWCWFSHMRCPVLLVGAINSNSSLTTNAAQAHLSHH
jgi:hypothetical protein